MAKPIAQWTDNIKVGIYDGEWRLNLYNDKAILHKPYVKWVGSTGGYAEKTHRITGAHLERIKTVRADEIEDECDYTHRIKDLIWDY